MKLHETTKSKWPAFVGISILLLTGCATGPSAPSTCPQPPELTTRTATGLNWQDAMRSFLNGTPQPLQGKTKP